MLQYQLYGGGVDLSIHVEGFIKGANIESVIRYLGSVEFSIRLK